jgi:uncharacterized protein YjiS (DUF1127 family)
MKTTHSGSAFTYGLARLAWTAYRAVARVVALPDALYDWQQRARTRRQLMALDDRLLRDMGISRYDALREGGKPFWRN